MEGVHPGVKEDVVLNETMIIKENLSTLHWQVWKAYQEHLRSWKGPMQLKFSLTDERAKTWMNCMARTI